MDSLRALAMGEMYRGREKMVFDWVRAASILREKRVQFANAGLQDDLEYTSGEILSYGEPNIESYTFLSSTWATPVLIIDDDEIPCFVMESETEWDHDTKWPDEAIAVFRGEKPRLPKL